jgi:hypothetical protein
MKKVKSKNLPSIRKVRNRLHQDEIYYTQSDWQTKEIDGVTFIPVLKQPTQNQIFWMKKDNMEYVK